MENLKQDLSNKYIYNSNPFLIYLMNYRFKKTGDPKTREKYKSKFTVIKR